LPPPDAGHALTRTDSGRAERIHCGRVGSMVGSAADGFLPGAV